ncbi:recombinase family protein [Thioclava kandeliae]|uniref:Recombinase family protein n=1 Tax=Thioclava kandeliae TaxID=3070818 RepID=A0ABV1SEK4_9RHOB
MAPKQHPEINNKCVIYTRVSTLKQEGQTNLEKQRLLLEEFADKKGFMVVAVYSETKSVGKSGHPWKSSELGNAVAYAWDNDAFLLVYDSTRLFRQPVDAKAFWKEAPDLHIFSLQRNRIIGKKLFYSDVRNGEKSVINIQEGTKRKLKAIPKKETTPKAVSSSRRGGKKSGKVRQLKAKEIQEYIAHVLLERPSNLNLPDRELAELLNKRGYLNARRKAWTKDNVRNPRRSALALLRERDLLPTENDLQAVKEDEERMKALPFYGAF